MTITFGESLRGGAFIISEAPGRRSRSRGVLATSGLAPGSVVMMSAGKLVPYDGGDTAAGILITWTPDGLSDVPVAYLARAAEISLELVAYDEGTADDVVAALAGLGLTARTAGVPADDGEGGGGGETPDGLLRLAADALKMGGNYLYLGSATEGGTPDDALTLGDEVLTLGGEPLTLGA